MSSSESPEGSANNNEENQNNKSRLVGIAVAGAVAVASIVSFFASGSSAPERKTMKAPGRNDRIYRDEFEKNPAGYFQDLRKK